MVAPERDIIRSTSTACAMDIYLDHLDTLLTAISQRPMTDDQLDRCARLLNRAESDCLGRIPPVAVRLVA
jgi:hypothetical protein